ncbi:hypothetical protein LIER_00156 [Lithospermum erythrorhizon]|uniref:Uncharacterized protein n=1 Tax=Lithospermum erythrorhizon TaxID=34254 RepID=A0AAV3NL09_LITER
MDAPNLSINRCTTSRYPSMELGGSLWNHFSTCRDKLLGNALTYTSSSFDQKDSWESNDLRWLLGSPKPLNVLNFDILNPHGILACLILSENGKRVLCFTGPRPGVISFKSAFNSSTCFCNSVLLLPLVSRLVEGNRPTACLGERRLPFFDLSL